MRKTSMGRRKFLAIIVSIVPGVLLSKCIDFEKIDKDVVIEEDIGGFPIGASIKEKSGVYEWIIRLPKIE